MSVLAPRQSRLAASRLPRPLDLIVGAFCLSTLACSPNAAARVDAPRPNGWNVLIVVVDTLRADHLGLYGYERQTSPHIDALAQRAVVFDTMYSQAPWTKPSVASIFTSLYPVQHQVLREGTDNQLAPAIETLAEILQKHGYRTAAVSENPHVQRATGFDQGFDHFTGIRGYKGDSGQFMRKAKSWLMEDSEKPFFLYVHLLDPHGPYAPDDPGAFLDGLETSQPLVREGKVGKIVDGESLAVPLSAGDVAYLEALYDAEIREIDEAIGGLVEVLETRGLLENTVVVLTSDHGEEFLEHGAIKHGYHLYEESVRVPLVLLVPGLEARRVDDTLAQHIDLAPTLLDLVGIPIPDHFQGRSLRRALAGEADAGGIVFVATSWRNVERVAIRAGDWKLVQHRDQDRLDLYRLSQDPGEQNDVSAEHADVTRRLLEEYEAATRPIRGLSLEGGDGARDPEIEDALRAIGYTGGDDE